MFSDEFKYYLHEIHLHKTKITLNKLIYKQYISFYFQAYKLNLNTISFLVTKNIFP